MKDSQHIEETGVLKDSQLDHENGGLKQVNSDIHLSASDVSGPDEMQTKDVKKQTDGKSESLWDKAGEAVAEIKDAFNPNSKDPATGNG